MISIASADGRQSVFVLTSAAPSSETPAEAQLVFDNVAGQYFLARVTSEGGTQHEIMLTPARMERDLAATGPNP